MVQYSTLLKTRIKNYEKETSGKGKDIGEASNPLTIEKPAETMPKILKGVFKKTLHNPNARDASNYSVVEELAQTPCAMLALEVLQSCLAQWDALLASLGSMDSSNLMEKFNLSNVKIFLPYHVALLIDVIHGGKTIVREVVDEGASTCIMCWSCWKYLGSPELVPSNTLLTTTTTFRPKIRRPYCRIFDTSLSHVRHYDFF